MASLLNFYDNVIKSGQKVYFFYVRFNFFIYLFFYLSVSVITETWLFWVEDWIAHALYIWIITSVTFTEHYIYDFFPLMILHPYVALMDLCLRPQAFLGWFGPSNNYEKLLTTV